jgi:hypothetical protein
MTGAQAFLMDNNYEPDYGMKSYDGKQSYGKDGKTTTTTNPKRVMSNVTISM